MADEFDRSYENAPEQAQPDSLQESPLPYKAEEDDRTDLMNLLAYLEDELTRAKPIPFTNMSRVNAQMCIDIINDIRDNLPLAVQYSEQMLRDRERVLRGAEQAAANRIESANVRANAALDDANTRAGRILEDAQKHADNIVRDAEVRARAMIDQNSIKLQAQDDARQIINEASLEAHERRQQAADYCDKLLRDAEDTLQAAYDDVRRNRQNLGQMRAEGR